MQICDFFGKRTKINLDDIIGCNLSNDAQNIGVEIFRPSRKIADRLYFQFDGENNILREILREYFNKEDKEIFKERAELMAASAGYKISPIAKNRLPKNVQLTWAYEVTIGPKINC